MTDETNSERRVMVIDDSPLILEITALMLEDAGWTVRGRPSAFHLSEDIADFLPQVILLDLGMPNLEMEALPALIAEYREAGAKRIVLHSGRSAAELREVAEQSGADGFMVKTGDEDELARELETWLTKA